MQRRDPDFIDLSSKAGSKISSKTTLQIHISQDEFCRNIDNVIDEQFSYSFTKVHGSETLVAPPILESNSRLKRHLNHINSSMSIPSKIHQRYSRFHSCKFPRWLNKKWRNLKQTKQFMLDYRLDSLLVSDEKNSVIINRYTCEKMKSRKSNLVQAVVKSLNGW